MSYDERNADIKLYELKQNIKKSHMLYIKSIQRTLMIRNTTVL